MSGIDWWRDIKYNLLHVCLFCYLYDDFIMNAAVPGLWPFDPILCETSKSVHLSVQYHVKQARVFTSPKCDTNAKGKCKAAVIYFIQQQHIYWEVKNSKAGCIIFPRCSFVYIISWLVFILFSNNLFIRFKYSALSCQFGFFPQDFFQLKKNHVNSMSCLHSVAYQRMSWEALKKSINGLINKVNISNIIDIIKELFQENIVRGR